MKHRYWFTAFNITLSLAVVFTLLTGCDPDPTITPATTAAALTSHQADELDLLHLAEETLTAKQIDDICGAVDKVGLDDGTEMVHEVFSAQDVVVSRAALRAWLSESC